MAHDVIPDMALTYIRSTGEHVSANIFGPSRHGDNYIHLKFMRKGKEIEHNAAFDKVLFPILLPYYSTLVQGPSWLSILKETRV